MPTPSPGVGIDLMSRLALSTLLLLVAPGLAQDLVPGKVLELELRASDPVLAGHGPSRTFAYPVTCHVTLCVWAASKDFNPILRVTKPSGEAWAEDDDSGGGTTAFLTLEVEQGERPSITVAARDARMTGTLRLLLSEWPAGNSADLKAYRVLLDESKAARGAGDFVAARAKASEVLSYLLARPVAEQDAAWLELLASAGQAAFDAQDPSGANAAWKRVCEVLSAALPEDHPWLQTVRLKFAATLRALGELPSARTLEEKALAVCSRTLADDHPDLQAARVNLANTLFSLGDLAGARTLQEKVLEVYSRTLAGDHPDLQTARQNLALTIKALGDLARARALEEGVLEVRVRTLAADHPDLQAARNNFAATLHLQGDLAGARTLQEKVLEVDTRTLPDGDPRLQVARQNLAATIKALGDLAGARALEEKVLEVRSRTLPDEHPDLQGARQNLAGTLMGLGDLPGAQALFYKVLEVDSRTLPEDHPALQIARGNVALTLYALGQPALAQILQRMVLEVDSRTLPGDHPDLQVARLNLGITLSTLGDLAGARALEERVLEVFSRTLPDDHPALQMARGSLALMLAREAARAGALEGARARCAELISALCHAQVRAARAAILASPAREAEERCASLALKLDGSISFAQGYGVFEPLRALESEAFVLAETTRGAALASAELSRRAGHSPKYAVLREALRAASDALAALAQRGTTSEEFDRARVKREAAERELVALARALSGGKATGVQFDVESLAGRLAPGEAAVSFRRYAKWRSGVVGELDFTGQPAVREVSVDSLCAFVVRSSKGKSTLPLPLTLVDLGPIEPIEATVRAWREAIGVGLERGHMAVAGPVVDRVKESGEKLRELVFDPLLPSLAGAQRVVVVLDDVLHLVPLEAMPLSATESSAAAGATASNRLVGDRWRIETRATLTELLLDSPVPSGTALVALGGASFNVPALALTTEEPAPREAERPAKVAAALRGTAWERGFTPLTHTGEEARGIGALYQEVFEDQRPALVLEKRKASRAALEALASKARFVHIATHGWFAPESVKSWSDAEPLDKQSGLGTRASGAEQVKGMSPMLLCGLALAGANLPEDAVGHTPGLVTADQLSTLDLSNCELVVLSACDTNVGERRAGQGVASLQRALQMAGARSVITSLWKVPDEATKELMLDFYRRLWVEKKPKGQALWEAKTKLREAKDETGKAKYTTRDWAAWVLTGDPD